MLIRVGVFHSQQIKNNSYNKYDFACLARMEVVTMPA